MSGYQTTDFINSCEVLKLYRIYYNPYRQKQHVATIFRKQDGGFEVHRACLVSNERYPVSVGGRTRYVRRLKIVTTSYNVVEFQRRWTGEYETITDGYELDGPNYVTV